MAGVKREDRVCKECNSGEMEDVMHWLEMFSMEQPSSAIAVILSSSIQKMKKAQLTYYRACRNNNILSIIMSMLALANNI